MEAQAKRTQGGPSEAIIQERKRMLITRGEGRIFPGNEKSKAKHREILTKKKKKKINVLKTHLHASREF